MADTEKKWYVLRAVSGKEAKVKEYIDAQLRLNEKLAERVFQVNAAVAKVSCKHGLWLVARVN